MWDCDEIGFDPNGKLAVAPGTPSIGIGGTAAGKDRSGQVQRGRGGYFFTSSKGSEFLSLRHASMDGGSDTPGVVSHITTESIKWDVIEMSLSPTGELLAFVANEGGAGRIYLMSTWDFAFVPIDMSSLPSGVVSSLSFDATGTKIGFGLDSTMSPGNAYSIALHPGQ